MRSHSQTPSTPRTPLVALVALVSLVSLAAVPPRLAPSDLAAGRMLIATRQVVGRVFAQSVVLLLAHDEANGAIGLIVNRRSEHLLAEFVPDAAEAKLGKSRIHLGGPVSLETIQVLFRADETQEGAHRILEDLHASARSKALRALIAKDTPPEAARVYVGYAGWAPGQLENEIARGDWIVMRGDARLVFHSEPERLWEELFTGNDGLQVYAPTACSYRDS